MVYPSWGFSLPLTFTPDRETAILVFWISWALALNFWSLESGLQIGIRGDLVTEQQVQGHHCVLYQGHVGGEPPYHKDSGRDILHGSARAVERTWV